MKKILAHIVNAVNIFVGILVAYVLIAEIITREDPSKFWSGFTFGALFVVYLYHSVKWTEKKLHGN